MSRAENAELLETRVEEPVRPAQSAYIGRCLRISVIIATTPDVPAERSLASLRLAEYPPEHLEVLLTEGSQPSRQRNVAAAKATGEILYFLDDDSEVDIDLFRFVVRTLADPNVAVVGGPSEILPSDSLLQKCFGYVLGSFFAVANVRCRYKSVGRGPQKATEHKLILCNLGIRKDVFREEGGLDERLYPNEENELLNRLRAKDYVMVYNPRISVRRPHRTTLGSFMRQMFTYGQGRMYSFILHPQFISPAHLLPLALLCYMLSLPTALALQVPAEILRWYLVPAGVYAFASALSTGRIVVDEEDWRPVLFVPFLFLAVHFSYAVGLLFGLLRDPWKSVHNSESGDPTVLVRVLKPFGRAWD